MSNEHHSAPIPALPTLAAAGVEYSWSTDEETFRDQCCSIQDAVAAAVDFHGGELRIGATVWIGEVRKVKTTSLVDAGSIVERMQEVAFELSGEASEDYLPKVTPEQLKELQELVASWADRIDEPGFWQVVNIISYVLQANDLDEVCEGGDPECGPVTNHDSEAVPLCAVCWEGLLADIDTGHAAEVKS